MYNLDLDKLKIDETTIVREQTNLLRKVSIVDGIITSNERVDRNGINARSNINGKWGMASSSTISFKEMEKIIEKSKSNATTLGSKVREDIKNTYYIKKRFEKTIPTQIYEDIEQIAVIDLAQRIDCIILKRCNNISSRKVMIYVDCMKKNIRAGKINVQQDSIIKRSCVYFEMSIRDSCGIIQTVSDTIANSKELMFWNDVVDECKEAIDKNYKYLLDKKNAINAKRGVFPCILHPKVSGLLVHEAIGHNVEADIVRKGSFVTTCDRMVASEKVSITDFAYEAFGKPAGLPLYLDDEGTLCENVNIVKEGEIVGYLHDIESSKAFDRDPKGNARAYLAFDEPLIRMRNTAFLPGKDNLKEMIASIDYGYFLISPAGGQADTNGELVFYVDMGYIIENGKITNAINDTTISGNAMDMLASISMVSNDFQWDISGLCGKMQSMILASGGPYIKCNLYLGKD
ncbi:MAG: TldD/PmbA family protein [Erysipelotrichaceae bacterium]